ncbi:MAG: exodeoxyribonuclease VII large subunit [Lentisphaerae bacterium]|nr:exodeoxyribonuclease VII large subunit [Lentisphaerota bacterium]
MDKKEPIWSISEVNAAVRELVENSLMPFWLQGEVGTLNVYSSGHVYLTLKDQNCQLKCTFFRGAETVRKMRLAVGVEVEAFGKLTVYAQRGEYQFNIKNIRIAGAGSLQQQFEEIKNRLAAEGLFDAARKLPLPQLPRTIGVITSADGAAIRDFVNIARRRSKYVDIKIYPAVVQGSACAESVMRGIDFFHRPGNVVDVLVITRGGGSMEDLWGFNSEALARRIAASNIPVVSAIGHEIDFTIADFVASLRAPTPSAAAELTVPEQGQIMQELEQKKQTLQRAWQWRFMQKSRRLEQIAAHRLFHEPEYLVRHYQQKVDNLSGLLEQQWQKRLQLEQNRLQLAQAKLQAIDPGNVLKRGFAILMKNDRTVADSRQKLASGEKVTAMLQDGNVDLTVD